MEPPNFIWYLGRLHTAAKRVYNAGGIELLQSLFQMIVRSNEKLSDQELAVRLRVEVHPEVERVLTEWPD